MSEKKYSVTITAKSGDRELTETVYPDLTYGELVQTESAIAMGLLRAGVAEAVLRGEDMPEAMLKVFGVEGR